jgi:ABC-type lipoprotein export system ATPase subunit
VLTNIRIRNFKMLEEVEFELGKSVVLIGPNNSGKTTALQAIALWNEGLGRWREKREGRTSPEKRSGVAINRRDLISIPVPDANLLWHGLHVRNVQRIDGEQKTSNITINITVDGVTNGRAWSCGFEFDYANEESFYCRPLRLDEAKPPRRMPVPPETADVRVAFLPPMSGLADREYLRQPGEIGVLIGQGQTAQVLRNLCFQICQSENGANRWDVVCGHISELFGVSLSPPDFIKERSEITMTYREPRGGRPLDLSSSGRGLQQTLLLLAHLYANPRTVLLLDEPDAHLETLRQNQIYQLLTSVAEQQGSQIIAASHSEVVLNEAADRDLVIAFVGKPHRIGDRGTQVLKSLRQIGFDQYYQAEQTGWVLYLEGSTDLAILRAFAGTLGHAAAAALSSPFVHYVGNRPPQARDHFFGLREAKADLMGIAIFDRLEVQLQTGTSLSELMWKRREIENYLCNREVLIAFARGAGDQDDLFGAAEAQRREAAMAKCIDEFSTALRTTRGLEPWSSEVKASEEILDRLFDLYFKELGLSNLMRKTDYHILAALMPREAIDSEVVEKLDAIVETATRARPRE